MAKGIYLGTGVVKQAKKVFVGVAGAVKKVKAVYICVAGAIKKVFSADIVFLGEGVISLPAAIRQFTGFSSTNYAMFVGGYGNNGNGVAFNAALVRTEISNTRNINNNAVLEDPAIVELNGYIICASGHFTNSTSADANVQAYNGTTLVKSLLSQITNARCYCAGVRAGNYALFGGGRNYETYLKTVETYNASLVKGTLPDLTYQHSPMQGNKIGNNSIMNTPYRMYVYDQNLVRREYTNSDGLNMVTYSERAGLGATSKHAVFVGGLGNSAGSGNRNNLLTAYDVNFVKSTPNTLSSGRYDVQVAVIDDNIVCFGMYDSAYTVVEIFDSSFVKQPAPQQIPTSRPAYSVAKVGSYALAAGGSDTAIITLYGN